MGHDATPVPAGDPAARIGAVLGVGVEDLAELFESNPDVVKAVRGGLAEQLLGDALAVEPLVAEVRTPSGRHTPDRVVVLTDGTEVSVEVKNADVAPLADGSARLDLRRAAVGDERLYRPDAFDVVAACMHSRTGRWEWRWKAACRLDRRTFNSTDGEAVERLDPNQRLDSSWRATLTDALADAGLVDPDAPGVDGPRVTIPAVSELRLFTWQEHPHDQRR